MLISTFKMGRTDLVQSKEFQNFFLHCRVKKYFTIPLFCSEQKTPQEPEFDSKLLEFDWLFDGIFFPDGDGDTKNLNEIQNKKKIIFLLQFLYSLRSQSNKKNKKTQKDCNGLTETLTMMCGILSQVCLILNNKNLSKFSAQWRN